ncbi:MAG: TolC family protein, partial [Planctomycetales bacterium]
MKWKSSLVAAMWLSAAMAVGASGAESSAKPQILDESFLESLRSEIRTRHPSVATVEARVRAAEAQVRALRLWEDPTVGAGVIGADRAMRQDQGDWMVSLAQPLPRLKWVAARRERARALRDGAAAEARWMRLDLERRAAEAAIALALADESIRITTDQLGWFEGMTLTAKERLKDPAAEVSEALRLESELARERQRWETLRRQRAALAWQLNLLLGRETSAAWTALQLPATTVLPPPPAPD